MLKICGGQLLMVQKDSISCEKDYICINYKLTLVLGLSFNNLTINPSVRLELEFSIASALSVYTCPHLIIQNELTK